MHYGEIKNYDIANGIGVRVSLFVSGCTNRCEHCFQPETWDFAHGELFTEETQEALLQMLKPDYIHGFTLLGVNLSNLKTREEFYRFCRNWLVSFRRNPCGPTPVFCWKIL